MNVSQDAVLNPEVAIFGGGCFWCTEAVFLALKGVQKVVSGYIDGHTENPTYEAVCKGDTGHVEAIEITFDSHQISYLELLQVFFATHDPTTLNRQGNDVGTQYRSAIFYFSMAQKQDATQYIASLEAAAVFENPVVTTIGPATHFYAAEAYHNNYYNQNSSQGYCAYVITPKLQKLQKYFKDKLKT
ncbi:peptide-methionine (S)-S-oxide reductase MsrA [Flavobacterium crassostreae]|uniref:Peptide methionine sulfoxide reductase MsrA n=1 Tax=Flavobacterium crassostreae TaxID=1763534 RepID=A0A1B9E2D4_9FLAO|nr:peptide-methionine (S)-S-oxide reductase MsrA [Flavobacterium crassostreae]OCB76102.1 peptide-methionine (S)-S-oxide reductase [Flavobacterium crassostreae]